jgi:tRNA threonylcarbamoyladenosine biosynthesis protein TsaB
MTILCIETSTNACSAAICIDGRAAAVKENLVGANHASQLPVFVEELLLQAHTHGWKLDAVALSQGPGSYTGLRIGTSIAKGLCYGLNIPLIPINTLQVLCATLQHLAPTTALLCPMLDARRMEVYTAFFSAHNLQQEGEVEAKIIDENAFASVLSQRQLAFFGDGAAKCKTLLSSPNALFIDNILPQAAYMGQLAEQLISSALTTKQMAYYEPFYLKEFIPAPSHIKGLK